MFQHFRPKQLQGYKCTFGTYPLFMQARYTFHSVLKVHGSRFSAHYININFP
jgi:hypothetical protein